MSNVTIHIAGRQYTVACAPGEEAHITMLGEAIDTRLAKQDNIGGQSEARLLLYAALLLADEAHESATAVSHADAAIGETLEALATRLELLAERLETAAASA